MNITFEEFVKEANKIHNDKYSYPEPIKITSVANIVKIICPKHGEFDQSVGYHLKGGGCKKCATENDTKRKYLTQEEFINRCKQSHPDRDYDYSKTIYKGMHEDIEVICPRHGSFIMSAYNFSRGCNCPRCIRRAPTKEAFIEEAIKIHGNKYDYSKVEYKNNNTKVEIVCPIHGSFWCAPNNHLSGKGCRKCSSSKGEKAIREYLNKHSIVFTEQKRFSECKYKNTLPFDFYIEDYNLCIEYQGQQHYLPVRRGNMTDNEAEEALRIQQIKDQIKRDYCNKENIGLLEITYLDNIESVLKNQLDIG